MTAELKGIHAKTFQDLDVIKDVLKLDEEKIAELEKENLKVKQACHKWFMRWREAKKDALYFDNNLQKQIEATLKLQQENAELKDVIEGYKKIVKWCDKCDKLADLEAKLKHAEENCINKICVVFKDKEDCVAKLLELEKQLTKAKELLNEFLDFESSCMERGIYISDKTRAEAEQFLKDLEK